MVIEVPLECYYATSVGPGVRIPPWVSFRSNLQTYKKDQMLRTLYPFTVVAPADILGGDKLLEKLVKDFRLFAGSSERAWVGTIGRKLTRKERAE